MDSEFYAPCTLGVEPALVDEVTALGGRDIQSRKGGVKFHGDRALGCAANLWLRSAIRVQELLHYGPCRHENELYDVVTRMTWERWLDPAGTLAVDASVNDAVFTHSGFVALRTKDAICDRFRKRFGKRPSVDTDRPDLPIKVVMRHDEMKIYRDWSGESLHKRGWRPIQVKSPLNEATAAGLLLMTKWDRQSPLIDPMCGSGTFPVEAAMIAADRAPGINRRFAFENWPDHQPRQWQHMKDAAIARGKKSLPFDIIGADRHEGALSLAQRGAATAGVENLVRFELSTAANLTPPPQAVTVVVNPPYGIRLGEGEDLIESWRELGGFLHRCARGSRGYVLCGEPELSRNLGLKADGRLVAMNGPIEARFLRYELFGPRAAGEAGSDDAPLTDDGADTIIATDDASSGD